MEFNLSLENYNLLNRSIFICGEINDSLVESVNKDINKIIVEDKIILNSNLENIKQVLNNIDLTEIINPNDKKLFPEVNIYLNTPGGLCYTGYSLLDTIKLLNKHCKTNIIVTGQSMSMGIPILLSVPLEQRKCTENSTFMIHQVSAFECGKIANIEENVKETKRLNESIFNIILNNTSITEKQLKENYSKKQDWFLTAQEALKLKLVSEIL